MKYDVLHQFRDALEQEPLSPNTRKQYYSFVKKVLGDLDWERVEEIDPTRVYNAVGKLKTANDVSAARNGLRIFCRYYPELVLELPTGKGLHKRNRAKRRWQPLNAEKVKRQINSLPDESKRLAYRLMLATGMRVSEVAGLYPEDISVVETAPVAGEDKQLRFELRHTKKGCADVAYTNDPYILARMPEFLSDKPPGVPLFGSDKSLKNKAGCIGFECHDLRRMYAKAEYACELEQHSTHDAALDAVRDKLRHENVRTTKRYLRRKMEGRSR